MSDERLREDELVSAYLDNEATSAEIAEVESDDALMARVEELRALRDTVAAPVPPLPPDQRDQMIGAALGVADAEARARVEAKVVPLHRPQRLLLAMAAAVVLLAGVVGAGLIASRGGDDSEDMAAEAVAIADTDAPADMAEEEPMAEMEMAEEAPMAEMELADAAEPMAEEAIPEEEQRRRDEEPMAEPATDTMAAAQAEAPSDDALAAEEAMEAAAEEAAPAATTTIASATTVAAPEATDSDDSPSEQVVDLGALESLESLFENIGASWSAARDDGALADSGACSDAVREQALESSTEALRSFVATVGTDDPLTYDALFVRRDDGIAVIIYASPPDCEIGIHELPGS